MAQNDKSFPTELPLYVCFNPYFPDKADLLCERRRLEEKLKNGSGLVRGIYLQVACPAHNIILFPHSVLTHQPCCFLGPRFICRTHLDEHLVLFGMNVRSLAADGV